MNKCLINFYHYRLFENAKEQFKKADLVIPLSEPLHF